MAAPSSTQRAYLPEPIDVIQPPDLETDDPNLATVVLPAPPPFSSVVAQRKDYHLKRPASLFSYLPASDPGTTYTGLMGGLGLNLVPEDEGRFRKRPRTDKRYAYYSGISSCIIERPFLPLYLFLLPFFAGRSHHSSDYQKLSHFGA